MRKIKTKNIEEFENLTPNYPNDKRYENINFNKKTFLIPKDRPVRIYCDGVFDMFHYGHARLFAQVKQMFPKVHLIVGVHSDEQTNKYKGVVAMSEKERYESVSHCKYVDEIIEDAPWIHEDLEFINSHDIDYVAHDEDPYPSGNKNDIYGVFKDNGRFIPTKRATHVSTTKIITGIVRDYDKFIKRQISRGVSYKDLNISYWKREQLRFENIFKFGKQNNEKFLNFWNLFLVNPIGYCYRHSLNILHMMFQTSKKNK